MSDSRRAPHCPAAADPRDYSLFTPWGPDQSEVIAPDDQADAWRAVTKPVGTFRHQCTGLRTLLATVHQCKPEDPAVVAMPFELPLTGDRIWLALELL